MPANFDVNPAAVRGIADTVADKDGARPDFVDPGNPGFQTSDSINYWANEMARKIESMTDADNEIYDKLQASIDYVQAADDSAAEAAGDWGSQ